MRYFHLILTVIAFTSCSDDHYDIPRLQSFDCDAAMYFDHELLRYELDGYLSEFVPLPDSEDDIGHLYNIYEVVDELNRTCAAYEFRLECYDCYDTPTPISEILIIYPTTYRYLDILTPFDAPLKFLDVHH